MPDQNIFVTVPDQKEESNVITIYVICAAVGGFIVFIIVIIIIVVVLLKSKPVRKTPCSAEQEIQTATSGRGHLDNQIRITESPSTIGIASGNGVEQMQSAPTHDKDVYMDLDVSSRQQNMTYQGLVNPDNL